MRVTNRLGDLAVPEAIGGKPRDAQFARSERVDAAHRRAARLGAGRQKLLACALGQRRGAARGGQVERALERLSRLLAATCAPDGGTEVDQGAQELEHRLGALERLHRLGEQVDAPLARFELGRHAKRGAGFARPFARAGDLELLRAQARRSRASARSHRGERRGAAPQHDAARAAVDVGEQPARGQGIAERLVRLPLKKSQSGASFEIGRVRQGIDLALGLLQLESALGAVQLPALHQRQRSEGPRRGQEHPPAVTLRAHGQLGVCEHLWDARHVVEREAAAVAGRGDRHHRAALARLLQRGVQHLDVELELVDTIEPLR